MIITIKDVISFIYLKSFCDKKVWLEITPTYREILEKGSDDVVSAISVQRDR